MFDVFSQARKEVESEAVHESKGLRESYAGIPMDYLSVGREG